MKSKKKIKLSLICLMLFIVIAVFGVWLLIFACNGECGSDIHGGMLTFVCPRLFFPKAGSIIVIIIGTAGAIVSGCYFVFRYKIKKERK